MRPVRNRVLANGISKTPMKSNRYRQNSDNQQQKAQDPVEVFCRLRPCPDPDENSCISLQSASQLTVIPPDVSKNRKIVNYTFNHVFTEHADQREIFEHVTMPLLKGFLLGENGLLFTYGVTGSGKTYTMCGEPNNPGVVPRCINVLFNTIGNYQTPKFLVKSDKLNGFEVQGEADALEERLYEAKMKRKATLKKSNDSNTPLFINDGIKLDQIDENLFYTVFVTYVEIYNNLAYDLLDENAGSKSLQTKILREDSNHNIYVNGVVEVEVKSAEEALEMYFLGGKRKRMAQTSLNTESSRSHSIFTIRLVIGNGESSSSSRDKNSLVVSQLSLVDLAGSERCSRTHTTGQRLKEAGSINNSLMALRTCLEILRENQQSGGNRIVPYRESRLTHLFKNYFEGEGKVKMVVCVNPSNRDYEETVHVMKFAEMTQEVRVLRPDIKIDEIKKPVLQEVNIENFPARRSRRPIPRVRLINPDSDEIKSLILYMKRRQQTLSNLKTIRNLSDRFRLRLVDLQAERDSYEKQVKYFLPAERDKTKELKDKLVNMGYRYDEMKQKCSEKEQKIQELQNTIDEKNFQIKQSMLDKVHQKRKIEQVSEKMTQELDAKLRHQREYLTAQMKEKSEKLELVKDILTSNVPTEMLRKSQPDVQEFEDQMSTPKSTMVENHPSSERMARRDAPVANVRYRRSRSAGDVWLQHRPVNPVPLGTVLQPVMKCRKSVSKLTSMKDVVNPKQSKYVLISQNQDEEGDLETKLYKGDIIPTCSGGAQVIFDDVEKLKQESPTHQPQPGSVKKLRMQHEREFGSSVDKCSISIEGHGKKARI